MKMSASVSKVFKSYPSKHRAKLLQIRKIILKKASSLPEVGTLTENLKWGEPNYVPKRRGVGTSVRLGWSKKRPEQCGMFFHCQTKVVAKIKRKYGSKLRYDGNRGVIFEKGDRVNSKTVAECVEMALTYYLGR